MADNAEGRDPGTAEASAPSALTNESVPEEGKGGDGKDAASPTATEESFKVLNRRKSMTRVSREMQRQALEAKAAQLRLRGKQALASHQFELACELLTDAISLCPESYKLHRLRSVAYAALHDYSSALSDAETVIELAPTVSDGYYHKGYALYHMRKFSQAAKAFQDGMRLNPQDRNLRQGFWDAVTLLSQDPGEDGEALAEGLNAKMLELSS
eukprot:CAMPEP_0117678318 /NCGR_PEP_ID=MMETSP0804-20121206/17231_1 /TAXON_ID=1074897 /ORGANISM="Tetraselmis astigmatica, Strain CCMP880" /LENGTH=212 /DNA_ID=CAMNT_0005487693 /DNA_START=361 /DNA_END=999 /DNA_ORIENTATION=-